MKLIRVANDTFINPDSIDAVEIKSTKYKQTAIIHIGSKLFKIEENIENFLRSLEAYEVDRTNQYFAG